jgi:hypothetical protein
MRLFTRGVASYEWAKGSESTSEPLSVIFPMNGEILQCIDGRVRTIYDGSLGVAIDPHVSPDGSWVAFVLDKDLFVVSTRGINLISI